MCAYFMEKSGNGVYFCKKTQIKPPLFIRKENPRISSATTQAENICRPSKVRLRISFYNVFRNNRSVRFSPQRND